MSKNKNIGKWSATVKSDNNELLIVIDGTFPHNGQKPLFKLEKKYPQGVTATELILILKFGILADPRGKYSKKVSYKDSIKTSNEFKTVLIIDEKTRTIARITVINQKTQNISESTKNDNDNHTGDIQGGVH